MRLKEGSTGVEKESFEIKRTVVETYQVMAKSKKEALEYVGTYGNPSSIIVKSETIKKNNTMKPDEGNTGVEKVEFSLTNGSHIVFMKECKEWEVVKYVNGEDSKRIFTKGHLPSIENALYFDKKLKT